MTISRPFAPIWRVSRRVFQSISALSPGLLAACFVGSVLAQSGGPASGMDKGGASGAAAASQATSAAEAAHPESAVSAPPVRKWVSPFPRVIGKLEAKDIGLVINDDDPYSVQVGAYYAKARHIPAGQILRVNLPLKAELSPAEFAKFSRQVDAFYGNRVQGLALAWKLPYAVACNSISGALALGYDGKLCSEACQKPGHKSKSSVYFGSVSVKPFKDHHMRLSMMLAAKDVEGAKALIDRGVRSDGTLGLKGAPPVDVHFVTTSDQVRSVRQWLYPPAGPQPKVGI
ncbi:MAG: TIGR03790 family protein, partial [Aquabacterium sp.]